MSVASHRAAFAAGQITLDELERRIEQSLLVEAGRNHPVPPGWQPLPPCDHRWFDATALGDTERKLICRCGETLFTV